MRTCWFLNGSLSLAEQLLPILLVTIDSCFRICEYVKSSMSVYYLEEVGHVSLRLMVPKLRRILWSKFDLLGKYPPAQLKIFLQRH
jgi:hypothetical protein